MRAYLGDSEEERKMTKEERRSFLEAVSNFHKLGEMIYSNAKLQEVTTDVEKCYGTCRKNDYVKNQNIGLIMLQYLVI